MYVGRWKRMFVNDIFIMETNYLSTVGIKFIKCYKRRRSCKRLTKVRTGWIQICLITSTLKWRHNGRDGVSNHQPHVCLLNRLCRFRSQKTSKFRVTGLCVDTQTQFAYDGVDETHSLHSKNYITPFEFVVFCGGLVLAYFHDDVIKWKQLPRYWPFVLGIHRSTVNAPHEGQFDALMLSLICAWINGWVNNHEAGDLRRHRAHYGVTVMTDIFGIGTECSNPEQCDCMNHRNPR